MNNPLRPMNLGEILDCTFQIYRAKFWVFAGIAAIPALVIFGFQLAGSSWLLTSSIMRSPRPVIVLWNYILWLGYFHVSGFLNILISPALINVASTTYEGNGCLFPKSLRFAAVRWRTYLWITILKLSAQLIIPELLVAGTILGLAFIADKAGVLNGSLNLPTLLIFIVPTLIGIILFVWLGVCFALSVPAVVYESISGIKALRRSWNLTRESRLRIFFAWLMVIIITWVMEFGLNLIYQRVIIYSHMFNYSVYAQFVYYVVIYFLFTLILMFVGPIYPIAVTLFYYDQRIRQEGYDIERMMEAAGLIASDTTPGEASIIATAEAKEGQA